MNLIPCRPRPEIAHTASRRRGRLAAGTAWLVLSLSLAGCGSSSPSSSAPALSENPVLVGTQPNSLPAPPAQAMANRYAGVDVTIGGNRWDWKVSPADHSYDYQAQLGVSSGNTDASGGVFLPVGDFEFFSDTIQFPYQFFGLNAEIPSGVSLFVPAFTGFSTEGVVVGVPVEQTGCLAPNGSVVIDFLQTPLQVSTTYATDALYGQTKLGYKDGAFTFDGTSQFAIGGVAAATQTIPFAKSFCIQEQVGYGLQSEPVASGSATQNILLGIGATGVVSGTISTNFATTPMGTPAGTSTGFVGQVEPASAIDLSAVTAGTYRGFSNAVSPNNSNPSPAYFGQTSTYVTTPVFTQTGTSLVGGFESFSTYQFSFPAPTVIGNVVIDFGTQDPNHHGLFPAATLKQQDPQNLCLAAQQSTGTDGLTYCASPVVALIGQSYGKFSIFLAGPDPTTGAAQFYALLQD